MNRDHNDHQDDEAAQAHRCEITAAVNAVIRTCADIVRDHSNRGSWTPTTTPEPATPTTALLASARQDVLDKLQLVIRCAETVIREIERPRPRRLVLDEEDGTHHEQQHDSHESKQGQTCPHHNHTDR